MPSAKKKKERSAPRQTLHHFFLSQSLSEVKSKPHTPRVETSTRSSSQQEIIIIDSDSDDAPEIVKSITVKRRKLSPKNVDAPPNVTAERNVDLHTIVAHSKENTTTVLNQHVAGSSSKNVTTKPRDSISFGRPFLLVSNAVEANVFPSFGKPFLLNSPSLQSESEGAQYGETVASSSKDSYTPKVENTDVDIDLTLDDWENGDDEGVPETVAEDEDEIEWVSYGESESKDASIKGSESRCNASLEDLEKRPADDDGFPTPISDAPSEASTSRPFFKHCASSSANSSTFTVAPVPGCPNEKPKTNGNAFSFLMSSFKENEVWKEATVAEDRKFRSQKSNGGRRKAPFYKVLQGMPIAVDAFKYGAIPGVTAYFLTHAHSDHYTNLSSNWKNGPIYCSEGTANLIIHMLSVDRKWVHALPMDTPSVIPNTNGVTVTLIEANHCPGSCLFFFEGRQTVNAGDSTFKSSSVGSSKTFQYLHCGDFRASPKHILHPAVKDKVIDLVYLDTTYLDPKYTFPPQSLVISACAELAKRIVDGQPTKGKESTVLSWMTSSDPKGKAKEQPKLLFVIGTYSIGKERIAKAIARALNSKIYCDPRKTAILRCQADPELHTLLTSDPMEGIVHLVPLNTITTDHLKSYLDHFRGRYDRVIGFRPTGWTYTQAAGTNQLPSISAILSSTTTQNFTFADLELSRQSTPTLQLYPVPYSEHSSFYELTCFAMSFSWMKMIATVNIGSETSRAKMSKWVAKWEAERKKRGKDTIVPHRHPDYW